MVVIAHLYWFEESALRIGKRQVPLHARNDVIRGGGTKNQAGTRVDPNNAC